MTKINNKFYRSLNGQDYKIDSKNSVLGKGGYIYKDKLSRFFDKETVKEIKKEMTKLERKQNAEFKAFMKTDLEKITDKISKMLGKPFRISEHKGKPSSYYYNVSGLIIRISDHELPFSHEKAMLGVNRGEGFARDFILEKGIDNTEIAKNINDFIKSILS